MQESGGAGRRWSRRGFLSAGAMGLVGLTPVGAVASTPKNEQERTLSFRHLNTGEELDCVYWADGNYLEDSLVEVNQLLRDFRTGDVVSIDPALLDLLHNLRLKLETTAPFYVISGYRSPRTNRLLRRMGRGVAKRSLHMEGMAVDLRVPKQRLRAVRQAASQLQSGGVGYYPKSNFVHLDVGRVRYW